MQHHGAKTKGGSRRHWGALAFSLLMCGALGFGALIALALVYPYPSNFPTFPRVTHTSSGAAGDPINLVLIGSQAQLTQSFHQAGWLTPDPITPQTSARIAAASLAHRSYPTAPISSLYVFGRAQDLAFEKPTSDVQNRGHIRLWVTGTQLNGQQVWLGQASYDHGIELSATNGFPTHHIAPTVDLERNAVASDLERTGLVKAEVTTTFASPVLYARNGGGDFYESDGDAIVINFTLATVALHSPVWGISSLKTLVFLAYDALVTQWPWVVAALAFCAALIGGAAAYRVWRKQQVALSQRVR
jgi:hypothetical protein